MEGSDADHPVASQREAVAERVKQVIGDLAGVEVKRADAVKLKHAAEARIRNADLAGSIGRL
jgi:hypothetical protein